MPAGAPSMRRASSGSWVRPGCARQLARAAVPSGSGERRAGRRGGAGRTARARRRRAGGGSGAVGGSSGPGSSGAAGRQQGTSGGCWCADGVGPGRPLASRHERPLGIGRPGLEPPRGLRCRGEPRGPALHACCGWRCSSPSWPLLFLAGARGVLLLGLTVVVSIALSYLVLRRQRDAVAAVDRASGWRGREQPQHAAGRTRPPRTPRTRPAGPGCRAGRTAGRRPVEGRTAQDDSGPKASPRPSSRP